MHTDIIEIKNNDNLIKTVQDLKNDGYRYVTMICLKSGDGFELRYLFDKDYHIKDLKYLIKPSDKPRSVSGLYLCAFLIENEYQDLFGLTFEGLAVDYKGKLYLAGNSPKTPLA